MLSENAPIPGDRRVWNESRTLADAGWDVAIVCAATPGAGQPAFERLDGIEVHRFPLRPSGGGAGGYAREYAQALWRLRAHVHRLARERPVDVVHVANPPDLLLWAARGLRRRGTRLVFDHHDLVPELLRSRFGGASAMHRAMLALERSSLRTADVVISTNESYRRVAIERGGRDPGDVFVVRNGPDLERFAPAAPDPAWRRGRRHVVAYVGVMGPQDGVDHALRAFAWLRTRRDDVHAVLAGDGDAVPGLRRLAADLGLDGSVEFAGWRDDDDVRRLLASADVCVAPEPPSPLNDVSTMIKIPEYLSMGRPVVAYDLAEARVSGGDAVVYARAGDPAALGARIGELLDDPARRAHLGRAGRERAERVLAWHHAEPALLAAYARATS
jgi:glycosyltransferase involved in cell wall biosynthesis